MIVEDIMIVVVPAYQPDEKLVKLVSGFLSETDYRIVIVDDGSSDDRMQFFSQSEAMGERVTVLHHDVNRGKGRAMKTAFEWVKAQCLADDGVVTVDADGQHLIKDVVRVCEAWGEHRDALVLGSRAFKGNVPLRSRFGNSVTRAVFAVSTGVRVYDTQTGLRAFSTDLIDEMLSISGERYEFEINQLLTCTKKKIPIIEITIETVYLDNNSSSHFNTIKDSWRIYKIIFAFIASSMISWLVDYVLLLVLTRIFSGSASDGFVHLFGVALEPKLPALILARIVSSFINYLLNRSIVFSSNAKGSVWKYYLLAAVMLGANYGLLYILNPIMPLAIAQILAQLIIYPINFVLQRKFVFNGKKEARK